MFCITGVFFFLRIYCRSSVFSGSSTPESKKKKTKNFSLRDETDGAVETINDINEEDKTVATKKCKK